MSGLGAETYQPLVPAMAGSAEPGEPSSHVAGEGTLAEGEDPVSHYLEQGDRYGAEKALSLLRKSLSTPDVESQQSVALLRLGKPENALANADAALSEAPRHAAALWNRGLALRDLRLPLAAARSFAQVASLKEPGWAEEATQRAQGLRRDIFTHRDRWAAVLKAGASLIENADTPLPEDFSDTPIARLFFYDAVRAAPTVSAVQTLLPLARKLDGRTRSHVLEAYVQRVAAADFQRRGPLAQGYAALASKRLSVSEREMFLRQVLSSQDDDLILGTLVLTQTVSSHLELFKAKADAMKDPWFQLLAAQERATVDKRAGRLAHAVRTLREALPLCEGTGLEYRCLSLQSDLSTLLMKLHEFQDARQYAKKAWEDARANNEWQMEQDLLWSLSQIARLVKDTSLSRAYIEEFLARNESKPDAVRRVHESLASIAFQELRIDEARWEIDAALATGLPLSPSGAFTLAEVARLKGAPRDEEHLMRALTTPLGARSPGERAVDMHALGRFFIERDVARGRTLLWNSIQEASAPGLEEDIAASRARAYSFTSLILEAGRRGAFDEALELISRERGQSLPERCLLAATSDSERTLLIVRGVDAKSLGWHDETRRAPLPSQLDGLVREDLLAALRPCERVEVLARPPLHGRAGLLPPSMAWSYLTRTTAPRAPRKGPAVHLVVSDVETPPGTDVLPLPSWGASLGPEAQLRTRSGADATPSRVRAAMQDATEIDLVAHGFIYDRADASYLLLSSERGGSELTVPQVRDTPLHGAPFVVLSSCDAAHTSYALHEPLSLPAAFIHAGARGVLAATTRIPGNDANVFFNQVRERMRAGVAPSIALRDVRAQWLEKDAKQTWLANVLLFE
ncbi:CHAT domain-containing protein [Corallococcus llansteffanensis]|uniref:CHAT domain-containing protein n=1 Tax=Corallococcus llansteffanensis TaxID=2316731 RepID=UPI00142F02C4|nr:CHAT domain-containing protein [Corallococcus llansteffanensis]